ncbi:MAG: TRAP transporter small permease [Pseudomonadota bacterium]
MAGPETKTPDAKASGVAYWLGDLPSRALSVIACLVLFGMMVLTFVDVAGRYLFSSPLPAAYEIIAFMMPVIIFFALPLTNRNEGHVTIDLFDTFVPPVLRRIQAVFVNLFAAGATGFVSWRLAMRSYDHYRFDEVTDELYLNLWLFSLMMAVLAAVAALIFVVNAYVHATHRVAPHGHGDEAASS